MARIRPIECLSKTIILWTFISWRGPRTFKPYIMTFLKANVWFAIFIEDTNELMCIFVGKCPIPREILDQLFWHDGKKLRLGLVS